ncbi:RNA pol II accessory factor, Cdc73 family-domain-containing protein [Dimargaris cristalligena]|uniref:RNA pol II accessory factor, Cdc73 family-domain-containing protein n=1 Tax=Dimargaris cristalligena TaxID=215637 RepID=A0A4V1J3Z9_9FUNG|nr:RNA pol II accessory factor, Cdc73 family-domain-containing protein [Dimargaris cristalligena]|eukprot:RKP33819.1 RNA pol II accessory factor, Cdc73 family-domain-containing protein [Dimargaris cristalligena]
MDHRDPLVILRDHIIHSKPITFLGPAGEKLPSLVSATHIRFTDSDGAPLQFERHTPTAYKITGHNADFYPLDSLVFLGLNYKLGYGALLREGSAAGVTPVTYIDMKHVQNYLTGVVETTDNVVTQKPSVPVDSEAPTPSLATKSHYTPHYSSIKSVELIHSQERNVGAKYSFMHGSKDLSAVVNIYHGCFASEAIDSPHRTIRSSQGAHPLSQHPPRGSSHHPNGPTPAKLPARMPPPSKRAHRIPLIIVPTAATSLITMYNVQEFLENHTFVPSQQIHDQGVKKQARITIERTRIGQPKPLLYHVVDSVDNFKPDDWDRLAAVFTMGVTWQFKKWKWDNPRELFKHVKGFYVKMADENPKDAVASWNVEVINVDRSKRHKDKAVVSQLWNSLDQYIASTKPNLVQ